MIPTINVDDDNDDDEMNPLDANLVGYTMSDIRYQWAKGLESVGVSSDVSLPQFKVLGHKQQAMEISLSTGYPTLPY